jgi:hypothetical protein
VAWRGREFTPEELKGFHLKNILGAWCMISVVHNENDGKTLRKHLCRDAGSVKHQEKPVCPRLTTKSGCLDF